MDWTNINIDPQYIEFVLQYGIPAVLAVLLVGASLVGAAETGVRLKAAWKKIRTLVDEVNDPLVIVLAFVTRLTPEQLMKIREAIDAQLEGTPLAER